MTSAESCKTGGGGGGARSHTTADGETETSPISMLFIFTFCSCWRVPNSIHSFLLSFSLRKFADLRNTCYNLSKKHSHVVFSRLHRTAGNCLQKSAPALGGG